MNQKILEIGTRT